MRIMFYGDSNTWGFNSDTRLRYDNRFTKRIQNAKPKWEIVEEGLPGRTCCHDDPYEEGRNGAKTVQVIIRSQLPLDLIVIMLGTNDAKRMYATNVLSVDKQMRTLLDKVMDPSLYKDYPQPKILIVRPPKMNPAYINCRRTKLNFGKEGFTIMEKAGKYLANAAKAYNVDYFETEDVCMGRESDGIHLDEEGHKLLAKALLKKLSEYEEATGVKKLVQKVRG